MSVSIDIDPTYGFVEFVLGTAAPTQPVDIYSLNDKYLWLVHKHENDAESDAFWADWRAIIESLGFPVGLSLAALIRVRDSLFEQVATLRKKDPQPAS